ncbi:GNAT family N-acetyltransferase [Thalassolituus sp. C2-1]|jgi:GNAT superfamily N-acetyltransferase|nr:GNAT family N-acetyltransferase [Thalassolituus sp. C2-1]
MSTLPVIPRSTGCDALRHGPELLQYGTAEYLIKSGIAVVSEQSEQIVIADLNNPLHASAMIEVLNHYADGIMGGGEKLSDFTRANLAAELARRPNVHVVLAFIDDEPAGLVISIEGFSTFSCKPLLNVHDVAVMEKFQGRGLSKRIMNKTEEIARELGCCKLTLEVLEGNKVAQNAYRSLGYASYELDAAMGKAMFWQKYL